MFWSLAILSDDLQQAGGGGVKGKGESTRLWEEEPAGEELMAR